jgi:hypothetical protein
MLTRRQMIVSALTALAGGAAWLKNARAQTGHASGGHRKSEKRNVPYPPW